MRATFVAFEGLDGSGKSTHLRRAAAFLRGEGIEVVETHEPGGTSLGSAIRGLFLDTRWAGMDGVVELLLVAASRRQHVIEVVEPALLRGAWVLCDRFSDSTFAYQGAGRGVPVEAVVAADRLATGGRRPDRVLLFDLPAAEARRRGQSPKRQALLAVDRLDREEVDFYERVRGGFLARASADPERFSIIDSSGSAHATAEQVRRLLAALALERRA